MSGPTARKTIKQDAVHLEHPRRRVLPQDITHIIMKMFGADRETLSACALVAREFTFPALCCLGRHITVDTVPRLRECANLIAKGSAFQHVRSLDLGITTKRAIQGRDWDDYLIILEHFARRRTLTRLWFSGVPFYLSKPKKAEMFRNTIISLAATVNELGLYSCHFSCYAEMISMIRAFPLCTSLYVRDCVTKKNPGTCIFAQLPQHTLHINDLELTSSSGNRFLTDVSTLVKDAALDISSLAGFSCEMTTADAVRYAVVTAAASPIQRFQLTCDEAEGFHVLAEPVVTRWPLKSLTIGPIVKRDDRWYERALLFSPNLPHLEDITILGCYREPFFRQRLGFWRRLDQLLSREDIFPRLEKLDICMTVESGRLQRAQCRSIAQNTLALHKAEKVYFWGTKSLYPDPYW